MALEWLHGMAMKFKVGSQIFALLFLMKQDSKTKKLEANACSAE